MWAAAMTTSSSLSFGRIRHIHRVGRAATWVLMRTNGDDESTAAATAGAFTTASDQQKQFRLNIETRNYNDLSDWKISHGSNDNGNNNPKARLLIKVMSSSVNISDVKMVRGLMPFVKPPIVSGRDYAGIVVDAAIVDDEDDEPSQQEPRPRLSHLIGKEVFGTGGAVGMYVDGSHSQYMILQHDDASKLEKMVTIKPPSLTFEEAGTIGVPYFTAYDALCVKAQVQPGDIVVVTGANGMVARAALGLAKNVLGASQTIGLVRRTNYEHSLDGLADHVINIQDLPTPKDISIAISEAISSTVSHDDHRGQNFVDKTSPTDLVTTPPQRVADVVLDTVGGEMTTMCINLLRPNGRLVMISSPTPKSMTTLNVFEFYRKQLAIFGSNSIEPSNDEAVEAMQFIAPYLADGTLKPLPIHQRPHQTYSLDELQTAFDVVKEGTANGRVVISPWKMKRKE